jgi:MoxR-like ATPase
MKYWAVGAHHGGKDLSLEFYNERIWFDGYGKNGDLINQVLLKSVEIGDVLILKSSSTKGKDHSLSFTKVKAVGKITGKEDWFSFKVDWLKVDVLPKDFDGISYRRTIEKVREDDLLEFVKNLISNDPTVDSFVNLLRRIGRNNSILFFDFASALAIRLNFQEVDNRINYGTGQGTKLAITVGQRYCLTYHLKISKPWSFIQGTRITQNDEFEVTKFDGEPLAYHYKTKNSKIIENNFEGIVNASYQELARTTISGYRRHTNTIFEKTVMDKDYREKIFNQAFGDDITSFELATFPLNQILYGPPGTGKTYLTKAYAVAIAKGQSLNEWTDQENRELLIEEYDTLLNEGRIQFCTFHQSMSYEDFVEGIKPATKDNAVTYEIAKGQFLKIAKGISNEVNPHILIIDEINRGNIAAIFGELITLLEESKRQGASDETWVTLTYSKEKFCLPPNLYIIGTMNTADRSVEALDTALRRRFSFIEMPPRPEILSIDIEGIDVRQLLKVINQRITALKDADHTIGHAWFIDCKTQKDVLAVMIDKVIPLLREHFYNENEKLEAVIGSQFFNSSIAEVNFLTAINGNEKGSITKRLLSREELLAKEIDLKQLY